MRFNFDLTEANSNIDGRQSLTPSSPATPAEEVQWLPLQNHPLFAAAGGFAGPSFSSSKMVKNLLAWDGASRLYIWDSQKRCLHRISVKLGEPYAGSILAATPSKVPSCLSVYYWLSYLC
jgi:nuclear pore complex protein Nup88